MRRMTTAFLVPLFLVLMASYALSQAKPSPTASPIKIGGSLPLTGIYSETAKWIKEGYNYWSK